MMDIKIRPGEDNRIVHGLWIGGMLSPLEELSIRSFLRHGHRFLLWIYDPLSAPPPEGTELRDANEIIPSREVFRYRHGNEFGHGQGSYAGFSDIFRYKLLYEHGGWWADMDMTCLRPLDFSEPYVFRNHDVLPVVGNLMKCPRGSELMRACYDEARQEIDAENRDWLKPIRILNDHISRLGLQGFIRQGLSNPDRWEIVGFYREFPLAPVPRHHVFHWMNEEWRARGIDKGTCIRHSCLAGLYDSYGVGVRQLPLPAPWKTIAGALRMFLLPRIPRPVRLAAKYALLAIRPPARRQRDRATPGQTQH